ncbi:MAG: hypothetical protein KDA90_22210 [Planctomycetaceae bacterium]|nr:hypothetical protein [Planctomycetaceae bacterium]
MNVHECPQCGSYLRFSGDVHACHPCDDSHVQYNLATTDEEQANLSESIRWVYGIDKRAWGRAWIRYREILQRKRADRTLNLKS